MTLQKDIYCILYSALWGWSFENYNPVFFFFWKSACESSKYWKGQLVYMEVWDHE